MAAKKTAKRRRKPIPVYDADKVTIRFSGKIEDLDKGVKHDEGKLDWALVPRAFERVVRVLMFGANKYAPDNWRKVPDWRRRYYNAARRHLEDWRHGERLDPESGHHHLAHAICCALFMLALDEED